MMQVRIPLPIAFSMIVVAIVLASVARVGAQGEPPQGAASAGQPFKTLRGVMRPDGTFLVGGGGMNATVLSPGNYRISFPAGTWTNPRTGVTRSFVPQGEGVTGNAVTSMSAWMSSPDGSGSFDVGLGAGDAVGLMATSANC
jgi:hypothetical protein